MRMLMKDALIPIAYLLAWSVFVVWMGWVLT